MKIRLERIIVSTYISLAVLSIGMVGRNTNSHNTRYKNCQLFTDEDKNPQSVECVWGYSSYVKRLIDEDMDGKPDLKKEIFVKIGVAPFIFYLNSKPTQKDLEFYEKILMEYYNTL